jgi:hypothetical protein
VDNQLASKPKHACENCYILPDSWFTMKDPRQDRYVIWQTDLAEH